MEISENETLKCNIDATFVHQHNNFDSGMCIDIEREESIRAKTLHKQQCLSPKEVESTSFTNTINWLQE